MPRFTNQTTGAIVSVREGKALGSEWEPVKAPVSAKASNNTSKRGSAATSSK